MSNISSRIAKLEQERGVGRVIVIGRPDQMTDEQLEAYLESRDISTTTDDLVVSLLRLANGEEKPWVSIDGERLPDSGPALTDKQATRYARLVSGNK